jgi:hypothetical protein
MHREEGWTAQNEMLATISEEMRRVEGVVEDGGLRGDGSQTKRRGKTVPRMRKEVEEVGSRGESLYLYLGPACPLRPARPRAQPRVGWHQANHTANARRPVWQILPRLAR